MDAGRGSAARGGCGLRATEWDPFGLQERQATADADAETAKVAKQEILEAKALVEDAAQARTGRTMRTQIA
jgi:hypothetical protein